MSTKNNTERAENAKLTIEKNCVLSLYAEAGDDGVFVPATPTEGRYARYWTDEHYTWEQMLDDIPDDDILDGSLSAITSSDQDRLISAAADIDDAELSASVVAYIRRSLAAAGDDSRQLACDAVQWYPLSGLVLDYLRGDVEADALSDDDVACLEAIAQA